MDDARVVEGDSGSVNLVFQVHATPPLRRLQLTYALTDLTASAATGDYSPEGGAVSLTPQPARLIAHWGSGQFAIPQGVALAPNGDVLAVDGPNGRIHRFSRDGVWLKTFGEGQLLAPTGLAVNAVGSSFVSNWDGRIYVYNAAGQYVDSWGGRGSVPATFDTPFAIAVDTAGFVYVSDVGNNRIQKCSQYGALIRTWSTATPGEPEHDGPLGIAVDAHGYVYAAKPQSGRILKFAPDGGLVATWTDTKGFCSGRGLYVDGEGNLLIADAASSRVVVLDKEGTFLTEWMLDEGPEQNRGEFGATGIVGDAAGNVFVGSLYSATIAHYRWDHYSEGTIVVPVRGDGIPEPDETLELGLYDTPYDASLEDATAIGTIVGDEPIPGADTPPVVEATAYVEGSWMREVVVQVAARDPDGSPIAALTADLRELPGATFSVMPDRKSGVLRWQPRLDDVRDEPYAVTFTARNAATFSTTTRIRVVSNLVSNPSFSPNLNGWNGHVGATLARVATGRGGDQAVRLTLPGAAWAGLTDSPNWMSPFGYGRRVVVGAWVRAETNRGSVRMQVREYQGGVLVATSTTGGPLTSTWRRIVLAHTCVPSAESDLDLTIDAQGVAGETFDVDDVSIVSTQISPEFLGVPLVPTVTLAAKVSPNPTRGRAVLEVFLPTAEPLRIELYDLSGRRRAVVADEALAPAGVRRFELHDAKGDLAPGVYWYRAWTASASRQGRLVVLE